ncbi:MAG: hypothetical protein EPO22_09030 [Dehalococcoidia bacterium]|nr:MAG: hypothetical protein EPO22_09030 [Dehalococcoidia bacterium]
MALIAVIAALLAVSAMFKRETCGCAGPRVPYATIAIGSGVAALTAFAAYLATGLLSRRE